MNVMAEAFAKVGLPAASVAFAAACHDLARLALNHQPNPKLAVRAWISMADQMGFRAAIEQYLVAVSEERHDTKSDGDSDHGIRDTHTPAVASPSETNPAVVEGQLDVDALSPNALATVGTMLDNGSVPQAADTQKPCDAPLSTLSGGRGDRPPDAQQTCAAAPRGPSPERLRSLARTKAKMAQVMSGVYIPDHRGGKEAFDDIKIRYYNMTEDRLARTVGRASVAWNLIHIAKRRLPANHELLPSDVSSRDVFTAEEMRRMNIEAAVFAGSGLISLPEEFRQVVADSLQTDKAA